MERASERCEAFTPSSTKEKEERYWKRNANVPLLSKIMLSLQEDPGTMWKFYKEHLDEVGERIKLHKLRSTVLPLQDAGAPVAATQWIHQREFVRTTAENAVAPRIGTLDYILKQSSE